MATQKTTTASASDAELATLLTSVDQLRATNEALQAQVAAAPSAEEFAKLQAQLRELQERDERAAAPAREYGLDAVRATVGPSCDESNASTKARWRVVVARAADPREGSEIKVGVNGRIYQVQRGVAVDLPPEAVLALADAVMSTAIRNADDQIVGWHDAPRLPFQILGQSVSEDGTKLMP